MQETQETRVQSLNWEDPLEKEIAAHSSILAWRIPWTEEPGGLQSVGLHRVRYSWAHMHALPFFFFFLSNLQVSALLLKNKVLDRDATSGCWEWGLDQVCFLIHCERVSVETPQYFCSAHWWYVYLILPVDAGIAVFFWCGDLKVSLFVIKTFFFR